MGWFQTLKTLVKFAGPKHRIEQFKIDDPILQFFIMNYDSLVRWGGYTIENEETGEVIPKKVDPKNGPADINEYIRTQLIPRITTRMEEKLPNDEPNPDSYFMKKYDVEGRHNFNVQNNIHNPELDHAYWLYQTDKSAGQAFYLNVINRQKKQTYDGWKEFLVNHPEYQQHPAFVYMVLDSILKASDDTKEQPPPAAAPPVIAQMFNRFRGVTFEYNGPIKDKNVYRRVLSLSKERLPNDKIAAQTGIPVEKIQQVLADKSKKAIDIANETGLTQQQVQRIMALSRETLPAADIAPQVGLPVEQVQDAIDQNNSSKFDVLKIYQKELVDHSLDVARKEFSQETKSGWLRLPMKANVQPGVDDKGKPLTAEEVWDKNLDILHNFSVPNSWCTKKNVNGPKYLEDGDIWILVENGKACVCIRWSDKNSKIAEIAGDQSFAGGVSRSCPTAYWREITDLVFRENLEPKISGYAKPHWDMILKERELNKSYFNEDGTPNMEEIEQLITRIGQDPYLYKNIMKNEQFEAFPEIIQRLQVACKDAWFKKIQALQGNDAFKLAEDVAQNAGDMPDFVLKDPAFIDNVHGRLSAMYRNDPERIRDVMGKVPNHWEIYPQGKEIFKQAVLAKYAEGLYWRANVFSMSRKPKDMKDKIKVSKKRFDDIQKAVGDFMPELNDDHEFELAVRQAKLNSAPQALIDGYIATDMPAEVVEPFFDDPANVQAMANRVAEKISPPFPNDDPESLRRDHTAYTEATFEKEFASTAPPWMRRLPGFQNFTSQVRDIVLQKNIDRYKWFDPTHKTDPRFEAYKKHILERDPLKRKLDKGVENIDERLLNDPDYMRATQVDDNNIQQALLLMKRKASVFFDLGPEIQQDKRVQEAYIAARGTTTNPSFRGLLVKEFPRLPDNMKHDRRLVNTYISEVINLLRVARPRTPHYLDCKDIDPIAYNEPVIVEMCRARGTPVIQEQVDQNPVMDYEDIDFGGPQQTQEGPEGPERPDIMGRRLGWYRQASIRY